MDRPASRGFSSTTLAVLGLLLLAGCGSHDSADAVGPLRLSTTTSTVGSGLFDVLIPAFEAASGRRVQVLSKGTGAALADAREGRADVILVHSRQAEDEFIAEGWGLNRRDVMFNDFVLLGPPDDPAGVTGGSDIVAALQRLADADARYVRRGDDSGTDKRDLQLWAQADALPSAAGLSLSGRDMLATLRLADEQAAYVLSDRGTYLFNRESLRLVIAVAGDRRLHNPYGVIAVNPQRIPGADYAGAMAFIAFITSPGGQAIIAGHGREQFGQPLFTPMASTLRESP